MRKKSKAKKARTFEMSESKQRDCNIYMIWRCGGKKGLIGQAIKKELEKQRDRTIDR